ncbi:Vip1Fa1 (plasmid) [Bacillus thuringiensis serovar morrisoni str. 4AA1]|uniref:binary toxin-like calcium binding domain-containing protein n=1 Tax=Bacillus TaxID=1386 RepID=UPI0009BB9BEF|nr:MULTISPECIES: binary toxin-like calcium binding domain-containing protein [Bacillus]MED3102453.1 PA14 domain-containing protein [Bacillus thuringiensis]MRA99788.1 hypothetical protein [Bacillus thuringiensis]OTY47679.1 hypothetical protein BK736_00545 [Bacillus thuringiensis serovar poloniensis]RNG26645.1 hypothetical protein EEL55_27540 [Bacillus thuringiensis]RUR59414.1 hypothetical protein ELS81_30025 [Bacillus sp. VKPM B-3276]
MKKKLASVVTCTLLAPMFLNGNVDTVFADSKTNQISSTQENQKNEMDRKGLLGYYFKGKDFNNLTIFAPTRENTLIYDLETANSLLDKQQQTYQSIRWIGLIKSKKAGDFTFQLSDDEHAIIEIDGKVISQKGQKKQVVHLEKDKLVPIKIEYQSDKALNPDSQMFKELKLFKINSQKQSQQVQQDELRNPEFGKEKTQTYLKKASKSSLFSNKSKRDIDEDIDEDTDTDGDAIPDVWEENGYTIKGRVAVKWDEGLADKGYKKFVSNPFRQHTAGDPYSDYEKASKDLDLSNAKETFNPLVAAFPSVNVSLENVTISKDENKTAEIASTSSNNWSYTNTEGASIEAGIGPEGLLSFGVSANYQHSETVAKEWGTTKGDATQYNTASAGYLNANVRYNNVGTAAIYDVKPTTNFVLDKTTLATIKAKENATADHIIPGNSYPEKGKNGIAITTMDDFNSHPITLNKQQLDKLLYNVTPLMLETTQVEGTYKKKDVDGNIITGGTWSGVTQQIEAQTASIIVDTGEGVSEKRIAAKDYDDPEDKTPSLTLKDALKIGYPEEIEEKNDLLYYKGKIISESSVMTFLDNGTSEKVKKQIEDKTGKFKDVQHLYDVKLTPGMNFTIKLASIYDSVDNFSGSQSLGALNSISKVAGGNTGKNQYQSSSSNAYISLSSSTKGELNKNTTYYLSMYMRADADTEPTIELKGEKSTIKSQKVKLNNKGYQRVDILVENTESNPIHQIYVHGNNKTNVYWDDVSLTEVSAIKQELPDISDKEIQRAHTFKKEQLSLDGKYMNELTLHVDSLKDKNNKPVQFSYKVKDGEKDLGTKSYTPDKQGNININFLDYNRGFGISKDHKIQIYAVRKDQEVKVAELKNYNMSGTIRFSNDGESGLPEIYGYIFMTPEGQYPVSPVGGIHQIWSRYYTSTYKWSTQYSYDFASFNSDIKTVHFNGYVKELDDTNGDDILAYLENKYESHGLEGSVVLEGDERGSNVTVEYHIKLK